MELKASLSRMKEGKRVILAGEFNLKDINWESYTGNGAGQMLCDITADFSFDQLVQQPTRGSSSCQSTLDLLLTNFPELIKDVEVVDGIEGSDHKTVSLY